MYIPRRTLLAFVAASFGPVALLALLIRPQPVDSTCCDHLFYRSMAYNLVSETRPDLNVARPDNRLWQVYQNPYQAGFMHPENRLNRQPPYVYRVLSPMIARTFGWIAFDDDAVRGFRVLTILGLSLAGFFTAVGIHILTSSTLASVCGCVALLALPVVSARNLVSDCLTDPLEYALLAAAIVAMLARRRWLFLTICAIGLFNKELTAFVLPAYVLREWLDREFRWSSLLLTLGAAVPFAAFRTLLPIPVDTYTLATTFVSLGMAKIVAFELVNCFGPLLVFAASRLWKRWDLLPLAPLGVGVVFSSFFVMNVDRTVIYAFPIVLLAVFGLRDQDQHRSWTLSAMALLTVGYGLAFVALELQFPVTALVGLLPALALECRSFVVRKAIT